MGASDRVEQALHKGIAALNGAKNGHKAPPPSASAVKVPQAVLIPLGIVLVAAVVMGRARMPREGATTRRGERRRPRNLMRYYGMGVLISALERDTTRKVIVAGLKYARQRA